MHHFLSEAAYRYYRTKSEENSAEKRGRLGAKKLVKRRHERKVRVSTTAVCVLQRLLSAGLLHDYKYNMTKVD